MQQRRLRPGDVLDDYCPRERRVTDHAIVAMIDDTIQQTRCVVCDAEHEYKQAKIPPQRKKKAPALFTQVLEGLKAPARPPHVQDLPDDDVEVIEEHMDAPEAAMVAGSSYGHAESAPVAVAASEPLARVEQQLDPAAPDVDAPPDAEPQPERVEGPFRRQLIRAALPRPEGATPPARVIPEFTIRQPLGRANRHGAGAGSRRRGQGQDQGQNGPMRFGRSAHGPRFNGNGRSGGQGGPGGQGGHGGPSGNRAGGSRRGGKKR
jgi:hypothetical protein